MGPAAACLWTCLRGLGVRILGQGWEDCEPVVEREQVMDGQEMGVGKQLRERRGGSSEVEGRDKL